MKAWIPFALVSLSACSFGRELPDPAFSMCVNKFTNHWHENLLRRHQTAISSIQVRFPNLRGELMDIDFLPLVVDDYKTLIKPTAEGIRACRVSGRKFCIQKFLDDLRKEGHRIADYKGRTFLQAFRLSEPGNYNQAMDVYSAVFIEALDSKLDEYAAYMRDCDLDSNPYIFNPDEQ